MSMTIDPGLSDGWATLAPRALVRMLGSIVRVCVVLGALVLGWIGAMALVTLAFGTVAPALIVIGPSVAADLPVGAGVLRGTPDRVVVSGSASVRAYYQAGAWLVLPALGNGCLDLRSL